MGQNQPMEIHRETGGEYRIGAYRAGAVTVRGEVFSRSLIVTPARLVRDWPPRRVAELSVEHLAWILENPPQVLLLGTGKRLSFPDDDIRVLLAAKGIGFEVMDTGAACRTYNLLLAEGRAVAAALLIEQDPA